MNITKIKGVICAVIAAASYGMNPLFGIPLYNEGMEPLSVLFYRFFLASILMAGVLFLRKDGFKLPKKYWLLTLTGGVMIAGTCLFWFLTFRIMDSGIAAAMLFIYPVMVAALMWGFFREKLTPGGTLSPKGNGFREEMPSWCRGRYFCPRMAAVIGRTRILPGPFWHPAAGDLHCWGNFFCGTDAFIEKNSYFWSNFTENILKHFLILMYFTVG